jgi:hypothetical protein
MEKSVQPFSLLEIGITVCLIRIIRRLTRDANARGGKIASHQIRTNVSFGFLQGLTHKGL